MLRRRYRKAKNPKASEWILYGGGALALYWLYKNGYLQNIFGPTAPGAGVAVGTDAQGNPVDAYGNIVASTSSYGPPVLAPPNPSGLPLTDQYGNYYPVDSSGVPILPGTPVSSAIAPTTVTSPNATPVPPSSVVQSLPPTPPPGAVSQGIRIAMLPGSQSQFITGAGKPSGTVTLLSPVIITKGVPFPGTSFGNPITLQKVTATFHLSAQTEDAAVGYVHMQGYSAQSISGGPGNYTVIGILNQVVG